MRVEEDKEGKSEAAAAAAMEAKDLRNWCLIDMVNEFRHQRRKNGSFISLMVICATSSLCFPDNRSASSLCIDSRI